jgi:hypothetical protein
MGHIHKFINSPVSKLSIHLSHDFFPSPQRHTQRTLAYLCCLSKIRGTFSELLLTPTAVGYGVQRGEIMAKEHGYQLEI